jgi:serine/threonine protein kinase
MTSRWPPLEGQEHAGLGQSPARADVTPAPPIAVGGVIAGKYRIDGVIGFGGMGIVCAATHLELGTPIAIKFVRPEKAEDERAAARFLIEARAAAKLQSQYACRVMDCGRLPTGSPYIVMEHLAGQDLRSRIDKSGPLPIADAVLLALQACEALAEAHSKHLVHRDVKPENLFVASGPGGTPLLKVLDFGISKQLTPLTVPGAMTDSHESMGSPFHMSPEQMLEPAKVDSRTDIWSLGVVLYEALTGQFPFHGETAPQLCANVMTTEPIPPQSHREEIPEGLARVILRCLQKDRDKRYKDVGELSQELKAFGGVASALAASHVEQILGRAPSEPPTHQLHRHEPSETHDTEQPVVSGIPGVPRKGFGLRLSVGVVLVVASVLAVLGGRRALKPASIEPLAPPQPSVSALVEQPLAPAPSVTASAPKPSKPKKPKIAAAMPSPPPRVDAVRTPRPDVAPPPPARVEEQDPEPPAAPPAPDANVYPQLTPVPELPPPTD